MLTLTTKRIDDLRPNEEEYTILIGFRGQVVDENFVKKVGPMVPELKQYLWDLWKEGVRTTKTVPENNKKSVTEPTEEKKMPETTVKPETTVNNAPVEAKEKPVIHTKTAEKRPIKTILRSFAAKKEELSRKDGVDLLNELYTSSPDIKAVLDELIDARVNNEVKRKLAESESVLNQPDVLAKAIMSTRAGMLALKAEILSRPSGGKSFLDFLASVPQEQKPQRPVPESEIERRAQENVAQPKQGEFNFTDFLTKAGFSHAKEWAEILTWEVPEKGQLFVGFEACAPEDRAVVGRLLGALVKAKGWRIHNSRLGVTITK